MDIQTLTSLNFLIKKQFKEGRPLIEMEESLKQYNGDDWRREVTFSDEGYQRVLLFREENYDLYLLCWQQGQISPIHDHPDNGCLLKVLEGELEEEQFSVKDNGDVIPHWERILKRDQISYLEGNEIVHRITALKDTVTLHIYAPPNYHYNVYKC